jgi:hypothetical protein
VACFYVDQYITGLHGQQKRNVDVIIISHNTNSNGNEQSAPEHMVNLTGRGQNSELYV